MTIEEKKRSKEFLHRLHEKYYGNKKAKGLKVAAKTPKEPKVKGVSRNALMLQAKAKGVKNFRILNKAELAEILKEGTTQERINVLVSGAIGRWKAGWGTRKQKTQK